MEPSLVSPTKIPLLQEKTSESPATPDDGNSLPPQTPTSPPNAQRTFMEGAMSSLLWGAFAPCIPIVIVTSVLLTTILHYRINDKFVFVSTTDPATSSNEALDALKGLQHFKSSGGDQAYYLYYNKITNPSVLHMIASWTAKIIPFVTGASMALVAFFAGQHFIRATKNKSEKLPSPHQVSILIGLLNGGGTQPLVDTIKYRWQHDEHLVKPVPAAFWSLTFIVVMT